MRDRSRTCIHTYTGRNIDLAEVHDQDIHHLDIAWALSRLPRFNGHTTTAEWSVAHHVLLVARLVRNHGGTETQQLAGVLHDAHEAYLGDVTTPVKNLLGGAYDIMADRIDMAICRKWNLLYAAFDDPLVKGADAQALRMEAYALLTTYGKPEINDPSTQWEHFGDDCMEFLHVREYTNVAAYNALLARLQ